MSIKSATLFAIIAISVATVSEFIWLTIQIITWHGFVGPIGALLWAISLAGASSGILVFLIALYKKQKEG